MRRIEIDRLVYLQKKTMALERSSQEWLPRPMWRFRLGNDTNRRTRGGPGEESDPNRERCLDARGRKLLREALANPPDVARPLL